MNAHSDEHSATPRKTRKVRKGTHSCRECRRRKVRCIFASPKDTVCIMCHRRGTTCVSQAGFEGTISPAPSLTPHGGSIPRPFADRGMGNNHDGNDTQPGLPPNQIMTRGFLPPTPASSDVPIVERTTHQRITQGLLLALPPSKDIEILLDKIPRLPTIAYQSNFKTYDPVGNDPPREQISLSSLLYPEAHPVLLARQMLLFAAALQHLSPNATIPGLTKHHHVIMEDLAESAIKLVTTNDALLGTLEGLENNILEGFYHIDSGNIRRAWITMRRAVMAAQLVGLHQPGHYRFKHISDQNDLDPVIMWGCIVSMERVLSLLLGLPTSTTGAVVSALSEGNTDSSSTESFCLHKLTMQVTGRILERNQITVGQKSRDMTAEIDRELIAMTEQLPSTFWRPLSFAGLTVDSVEAFWETRRAWDHMCYFNLVNQLHLPLMLCPSHAQHVIYSRMACVNASREILNREIAIRTFNRITACSRMGDFMALIAGMTLMLAHLVSHAHKGVDNLLAHQRLGDRATVEQALERMKSMSELHEDVLAAKCAALLKDMLAIEANAAQGKGDRDNLIVKVPYIGAVSISPEGITALAPGETEQHEGVTVGGIGSIHVTSPQTLDHLTGDVISDATPMEVATTRAVNRLSNQEDTTQISQVAPGEYFMQQDQMFPDAAAGMDDWVFQGFDTAFFDIVMRGLDDQAVGSD